MIDKELEKKIRQTKEFMQLWVKFHEMYKSALKQDSISPQEESDFLETKSLIARKYQVLKSLFGAGDHYDDRTFDVISQILSLKGVSSISDISLTKIENDWHNSYILLNRLLGDLESRHDALRQVNPVSAALSRLSENPLANFIILIGLIFFFYYLYIVLIQAPQESRGGGKIEFKEESR